MYQKNSFQNFMLILIFLSVIVFSVVNINVMDGIRLNLEKLQDSINNSGGFTRVAGTQGTMWEITDFSPVANREFFDRNAESGGRIIEAITADTQNMNSLINNDSTVSSFWAMATDSLAERNYERLDEFEPQLAESWTLSDDKMTYHIKLRKGILWHDFTDPVSGKEWKDVEVTADDFKFYVDVVKNEEVDAAPLRGYMQGIQEIRVLNPYEFEVIWNEKYFLSAEITLGLIPLPRHLYHAYEGPFDPQKFNDDHERNRIIVGCGPYRFVRWDKGTRVIMKRFEKYYGARLGTMPPIETLVYELIQHPNTRLQALIAQDLDMERLTPDQWINRTSVKAFDEDSGWLRKITYPAFAYNYIGLNQKNPLFQDRNVRVALSHLINRERIIRDVYFNLASAVSGPFGVGNTANDPSIEPYEFSVEKAKKLLAEAGWTEKGRDGILVKDGNRFTFTVIYPNVNTNYQKMLPMIKEDMAKAGINMEILALEWAVILQRVEKKSFDACMLGWTTSISPDPFQLWHSSYAMLEASSNHVGFVNEEADRLIGEIRVTFDPAERIQLYHAFHRLIHEEQPYLFLFAPYSLMVINKRYENVRIFPRGVPTRILWVPRGKQMPVPN